MSAVGFFAAVGLCAALGWALAGWFARDDDSLADRAVLIGVGGMVALHLWLSLLQAVGLRWTPATLVAAIVPAAAARWLSPRPGRLFADFRIELPRPRDPEKVRFDPAFLKQSEQVWQALKAGEAAL